MSKKDRYIKAVMYLRKLKGSCSDKDFETVLYLTAVLMKNEGK